MGESHFREDKGPRHPKPGTMAESAQLWLAYARTGNQASSLKVMPSMFSHTSWSSSKGSPSPSQFTEDTSTHFFFKFVDAYSKSLILLPAKNTSLILLFVGNLTKYVLGAICLICANQLIFSILVKFCSSSFSVTSPSLTMTMPSQDLAI